MALIENGVPSSISRIRSSANGTDYLGRPSAKSPFTFHHYNGRRYLSPVVCGEFRPSFGHLLVLLAEAIFHGHHSLSNYLLQYYYTTFVPRNRTSLANLSTIPFAMASDKEFNSSSVLDKELSPGDRLNHQDGHFPDPEMEGLSLYEKKALLVNRELDSHGMGKYQWYIFFLCGFGYLVDLLYAQAFGLVEPAMMQEFGFGSSNPSTFL